MTLDELNAASAAQFTAALGAVFENAPWVAAAAASRRPFDTVAALHEAMTDAVRATSPDELTEFLRGHPELAARNVAMGAHSVAEQAALGLDRMARDREAIFGGLNAAYAGRFGFPFIICVRRRTRASILAEFERRSLQCEDAERATALHEIGLITRLRLVDLVDGPGKPVAAGKLSTHVLDTASGRPAAGMAVELFEIDGDAAIKLAGAVTNADGRAEALLHEGGPLPIGCYELRFHVGPFYAGRDDGEPPFLGVVPVRFGIAEAEGNYHVPLLVSPGAYTTYRGS
jgi:2-oxo-4-hydroxy-4-carboxy-5-ureidoimidazoline decarboxylase